VVRAVGPLPGPPPADQEEISQLLDQVPAFETLSDSERLGLSVYARPMHVPAGTPIELARPTDALLISSGVLRNGSGYEMRRGAVIGPFGNDWPVQAGVALTPTRAWWLPTMVRSAVPPPPVPGPVAGGDAGPRRAPLFGAHPRADYPPLAAPPGVPPSHVDDEVERRFERWLWLLLLLLGLLALTLTTTNFFPGPAWAEMPSDRALFTVTQGSATTTVGRSVRHVEAGDSSYVTDAGGVNVPPGSTARLTFHGGGVALICGGSEVHIGPLMTSTVRPLRPSGELLLVSGRVVVDTTGTSPAFTPLALTVRSADPFSGTHLTSNNGPSLYAVTADASTASRGVVARDGTFLPPTGAALGCGPSTETAPPPTSGAAPTDTAGPSPSGTPSPSASATATPSPTPSPSATAPTTAASTTTRKPPPTTAKKTTTGPPPPNPFPPTIQGPGNFPTIWAPDGGVCGLNSTQFSLVVTDQGRTSNADFETLDTMRAWFTWSIAGGPSGQSAQVAPVSEASNDIFLFNLDIGPFPPASAGKVDTTITFTLFAKDPQTTVSTAPLVESFLNACDIPR
jgi:putative peptide zinc metalloprotease protein